MKKKIISTLLLSTVVLTAASTAVVAVADETDDKIASQDAKIASTKSAEAAAQAEVSSIQAQVDSLASKQASLKKEIEDALADSKKLQVKIGDLSKEIAEREEVLKGQARSAQADGTAGSYVDAVLNSKSFSDAVTRVTAVRTVVKANNDMMKQQEAAKADLDKAVKANQAKANEGYKLIVQMQDQAKTFETQQAKLKVAQLNLSAERATAEGDKAALLEQKAAAQAEAQAAAEREKTYNAQVASDAVKAQEQNNGGVVIPDTGGGSNDNGGGYVPQPTPTPTPTPGGGGANTYPVGECTWGVKSIVSWARNDWGNGAQWAGNAAAAGFRTGYTPQVGAIAVFPGAPDNWGYGHVAYVTAVNGSQIQVLESNYNGNRSVGNYRGWFNPGGIVYIYPN